MGEKNRGSIRLQFGDGAIIDSWLRFHLKDSFTDPLGSVELTAAPPRERIEEYRNRLNKGELVTVFVNDANQGSFIIQTVQGTIGVNGVEFAVTCQTPLVTPYQGSVDPKFSRKYDTDVPAYRIVLEALMPYGFEDIIADSDADVSAITGKPLGRAGKRKRKNTSAMKQSEAQAHDGEAAYAFAARIFTRLAVALRMSPTGQLMLTAPNYDQDAAYTLVQSFDPDVPGDRFLAEPPITIIDTNDGQFSECILRGARADKPGTTQTSTPEVRITSAELNPARPAYQSVAAAYKPLIIKDKCSRDPERAMSVAKLALGIRAAKAFVVKGYVDGVISTTGRVWSVDTVARTRVDAWGLDEDMWILGRELMGDKDKGQLTMLELLPKHALQLGDVPT
jgi:prophage tail gpP-like protein